jgi:hypothetical protein
MLGHQPVLRGILNNRFVLACRVAGLTVAILAGYDGSPAVIAIKKATLRQFVVLPNVLTRDVDAPSRPGLVDLP